MEFEGESLDKVTGETVVVKVTNTNDSTDGFVSVTATNGATIVPDTTVTKEACAKGSTVKFTVTLGSDDTVIKVIPAASPS